jgi:hypothetical protein
MPRATLRWVELAELLRSTEVLLLQGQALLRGIDPAIPASASVHLSLSDAREVVAICAEVIESVDQLRWLTEKMETDEIEIRWRDLERDAAAALALGVADTRRVELLARCLSVRAGVHALAAMLRCTDCHESWKGATIGYVLGRFREADAHFVRRLTAQALLSPEAHFDTCDREQIARLASVLEQHAAMA